MYRFGGKDNAEDWAFNVATENEDSVGPGVTHASRVLLQPAHASTRLHLTRTNAHHPLHALT